MDVETMTKEFPRAWHETEAVRLATEAARIAPYGAKHLVKANRLVAHARTHLGAIGLKESKRTMRLWAYVCKVDKMVTERTEKLFAAMEA